jgi:hypothetical protein
VPARQQRVRAAQRLLYRPIATSPNQLSRGPTRDCARR